MNKDFHFQGTYCAARIAGFSHVEAEEIAWAAQMVDDCTKDLIKTVKLNDTVANLVLTCETLGENITDALSYGTYDPSTNKTLQQIRSIWMPFHFLPGNLNSFPIQKAYTGKPPKDFANGSIDEFDFQCMCLHNSPLVQEMIDDTIMCYNTPNGPFKDYKSALLYLIGIRMHVLADTWAHEFFAGTPNYYINGVSKLDIHDNVSDYSKLSTPDNITDYSIFYHGHGMLGHLPDYGYLRYTYEPRWLGSLITKDNPSIYTFAFCQMVDALIAIRNNQPFQLKEYQGESDIPTQLHPYLDTLCQVLSNHHKVDSDYYNDWTNLIHTVAQSNPAPTYSKEQISPTKLTLFQYGAARHRDMVCAELHRNNIPGF